MQIESVLEKERIVCIYGSGGMGKTELVKQYLGSYKKKYSAIVWIHA